MLWASPRMPEDPLSAKRVTGWRTRATTYPARRSQMRKRIGASSRADAGNGSIMTVLGPIDADDMGLTLVHEHLILEGRSYHLRDRSLTGESPSGLGGKVDLENLGTLHRNPFYLEDNVVLDDVATMEKEVLAFKEAGGRTIVDQTSTRERRSPSKLVRLAQLTGINIVMGCGYHRSPSHPTSLADESVEQIAEGFVAEVTDGVEGDGPRAGIIGELGVSAPMGPGEEKVLMAGAKAQRETNLAISIHVHPWGTETPMGYEVVRILEREGADLSRVILSHLDQCLNVEYHEDMLRTGVNIAYDHFGKEFHRDATHISAGVTSISFSSRTTYASRCISANTAGGDTLISSSTSFLLLKR